MAITRRKHPGREKGSDDPVVEHIAVDDMAVGDIALENSTAGEDTGPRPTGGEATGGEATGGEPTGPATTGGQKTGAGPGTDTGDPEEAALAASQADLAKLQKARRWRLIKALSITAIALVFITFILQNVNPVGVRILAWTLSIQLIWVIVVSALLGALAGYLVGRPDKGLLLHGPSRRQEDTR